MRRLMLALLCVALLSLGGSIQYGPSGDETGRLPNRSATIGGSGSSSGGSGGGGGSEPEEPGVTDDCELPAEIDCGL